MTPETLSRRRMIQLTGAVAATTALAGCSGDGSESTPEDDGNDPGGDTDAPEEGGDGGDAESFDGWFDNVGNYDGVEDLTDRDEVTVEVGTGSGGTQFEPPAIRVSTGTIVVWEWTGTGGLHNVEEEDGAFESEMTDESGHTFERTFEAAETYRYFCNPHRSMGMKGVVVVE